MTAFDHNDADVVAIVGSGAGGGTLAGELCDKGVKVVVDMKSLLYLYGTELDYSGGLNGKGLTFNNPNASRTCSCGESFAV